MPDSKPDSKKEQATPNPNEDKVKKIAQEVAVAFQTYGGKLDRPLNFVAGVSVEEVVRFVLARAKA